MSPDVPLAHSPPYASRLASLAAPPPERYANQNSATATPTSLGCCIHPPRLHPAFPVQRQLPPQKKYLRLQRLTRPKHEPAPQDQIPGQSENHGERAQHVIIMPQLRPSAISEGQIKFLQRITRLGFAPRSRYSASCRRRNSISAPNDSRGRSKSPHHRIRSQVNRTIVESALSTP